MNNPYDRLFSDYTFTRYPGGVLDCRRSSENFSSIFSQVWTSYHIPDSDSLGETHNQIYCYLTRNYRVLCVVRDSVRYPFAAFLRKQPEKGKIIFDLFRDDPMEFYSLGIHDDFAEGYTWGTPDTPILRLANKCSKNLYSNRLPSPSISDIHDVEDQLKRVYGDGCVDGVEFIRLLPLGKSLIALFYGYDSLDQPLSLYDISTGKIWFDFFRDPPEIWELRCKNWHKQNKRESHNRLGSDARTIRFTSSDLIDASSAPYVLDLNPPSRKKTVTRKKGKVAPQGTDDFFIPSGLREVHLAV